MSTSEVVSKYKNEIVDFINSQFIFEEELTDDLSLTESGILDSMGVISVISFMETTYNIQVDDEEINQKNFGSVNKMVDFLNRKLA